MVIDMMLSTI